MNKIRVVVVSALLMAVAACGGSKVLRDAQPLEIREPLASAADSRISATLDWVIVRDGPGTWARNADWDEYLLRARNVSDQPVRVTYVHVTDSLGTRVRSGLNRRMLVKDAKASVRRYKAQGLKVKAGVGGAALMVGSAAVYSASATAGVAALSTGSSAAAAGALAGIVVVAPALAVRGMVRGINNSKVDGQIKSRRTQFPVEIQPGQEANLNIFFPLAPSPSHLEISYADLDREHKLRIDTQPQLAGLHLDSR